MVYKWGWSDHHVSKSWESILQEGGTMDPKIFFRACCPSAKLQLSPAFTARTRCRRPPGGQGFDRQVARSFGEDQLSHKKKPLSFHWILVV